MTSAAQDAASAVLLGLLVRVVARFAQGLQIARVEELRLLTTMRMHVIHHARHHHTPQLLVHAAQRVGPQLRHSQALPGGQVVEVVVFAAHE